MKTLLAAVAVAALLITSAQAQTRYISPETEAAIPSDYDGAFGVIALANYAIECMPRSNPLRRQTIDKMAALTFNFKNSEIQRARREVYDMIKRDGKEEFCRISEEAATK